MVVLSEGLVKAKTKLERLEDVKNLNVCGQGINDVSILQQTPNMEVLSLSVNKIGSLRHFAFCSQLKQLYFRSNAVTDLAQIRYLMTLQQLRVLWLADNPCTRLPHYRAFVLAHLPHLENLDDIVVEEVDRQAARGMRQLQPATAADVLAEDAQEAAEEEQAAALALQAERLALAASTVQDCAAAAASTPEKHQQLLNISAVRPSPSSSLPAATAAPDAVAAPAPSAAGIAGHRVPAAGRGHTGLEASQQQLYPDSPYMHDSTSSSSASGGSGVVGVGPIRAFAPIPRTPLSHMTPAAVSAPGSYRASPEPLGNLPAQQQGRGYYSVPLRDAAVAGSSSISEPGDMPAQLFDRQQQQQRRAWAPAEQHTPCSACCHQQARQLPQTPVQQWRSPEQHGTGSLMVAGASPAGRSTNVLYAVMALLGELDVSDLSIVQREVQLRLLESQQ